MLGQPRFETKNLSAKLRSREKHDEVSLSPSPPKKKKKRLHGQELLGLNLGAIFMRTQVTMREAKECFRKWVIFLNCLARRSRM